MPRHKLCGRGLPKVLGLLDFNLPETLAERTLKSTRIHVGQDSYPFDTTCILAIMTSRATFDAFLTEKPLDTAKSLQQYEMECMKMFGKDFQVTYRLACFSYLEQYDMKRITKFFLSEKRAQECVIGLMDGTISYRDARTKLVWPYVKYRLAKLGLRLYNE